MRNIHSLVCAVALFSAVAGAASCGSSGAAGSASTMGSSAGGGTTANATATASASGAGGGTTAASNASTASSGGGGNGGHGGSGSGTGGTAGTGGSGGSGGTGGSACIDAKDCVAFSDACNVGTCIDGTCGQNPLVGAIGCGGPCGLPYNGVQLTCVEGEVCVQAECLGDNYACIANPCGDVAVSCSSCGEALCNIVAPDVGVKCSGVSAGLLLCTFNQC